jgi:hypothetical protein
MSVASTNLPQLKLPLVRSASILGVPTKLHYPLKDSLYILRRTEPNSPTFLSRQVSISPDEDRVKISQAVTPPTNLKVSSMISEASRSICFKDLACVKLEKPADVSPSYQDHNAQVLERLRRTTKRKQFPQRSMQSRPTSTDIAEQLVSPQLHLPPVVAACVDDQQQLQELMISMCLRSAISPSSPTKIIRKVVGLDIMPYGSHLAYKSEVPFRTTHIVEKESAKWLNVHSSKRSFRKRKARRPSNRAL